MADVCFMQCLDSVALFRNERDSCQPRIDKIFASAKRESNANTIAEKTAEPPASTGSGRYEPAAGEQIQIRERIVSARGELNRGFESTTDHHYSQTNGQRRNGGTVSDRPQL